MLPTRTGDYRLPDDALVVRGGEMKIVDVAFALDKCWTEHRVCGLSVWAAETPTLADLCARIPFLPHPRVRWTKVGTLRGLEGVDLMPTYEAPHNNPHPPQLRRRDS
jgi:hypothetical protein